MQKSFNTGGSNRKTIIAKEHSSSATNGDTDPRDSAMKGGTVRQLLKVPEAAARMSISVKTAWKMVYGGKVDVVRIGRSVRIPEDSIDELIEGGTTPAKDDE
jgi:excisionase family DNA binding protein